jgi:hypothetical protein
VHLDDVCVRLTELQRLKAALAETVARGSADAAPTCELVQESFSRE